MNPMSLMKNDVFLLGCNDETLESMGVRLLDWFSVVMADAQKRKIYSRRNHNDQGKQ